MPKRAPSQLDRKVPQGFLGSCQVQQEHSFVPAIDGEAVVRIPFEADCPAWAPATAAAAAGRLGHAQLRSSDSDGAAPLQLADRLGHAPVVRRRAPPLVELHRPRRGQHGLPPA
eukprot:1866894-Pleurochrysis_carterae.AAC.3